MAMTERVSGQKELQTWPRDMTTEGLGQHGAPADMTPFRHALFCVLRDSIDRGNSEELEQ
jgi:hypothetical protein